MKRIYLGSFLNGSVDEMVALHGKRMVGVEWESVVGMVVHRHFPERRGGQGRGGECSSPPTDWQAGWTFGKPEEHERWVEYVLYRRIDNTKWVI